jgi:hypothetical protein
MLAAAIAIGAGCNRPSDEECRTAYRNMRAVIEAPASPTEERDTQSFVRQCRSQYSREAVKCVAAAADKPALYRCPGMAPPAQPPAPPTDSK